jgi:hypothetical protein
MRRWMGVVATIAVVAVSAIAAGVVPSAAQTAPPPIAAEALTERASTPGAICQIERRELLGGLISEYRAVAA